MMDLLRTRRDLRLAVLCIACFWLAGAATMTLLPAFARDVLHADQDAVRAMAALFLVGIGVGVLLSRRFGLHHAPTAAFYMASFAFDLWLAGRGVAANLAGDLAGKPLSPLAVVWDQSGSWRIGIDLLLLAVSGGVAIAPLYSLLKAWSGLLAASTVMNILFISGAALACLGLLQHGFSIQYILLANALFMTAAGFMIRKLMREIAFQMED